ncbi:MFS transporter [Streptomyces sp. Tue 6430]|nr:MFS transporter [Streptomyces sp. Tue 6430]
MSNIVDPLVERIAVRVRAERERRGWTLNELAEASGVSRAMIHRIERGESSPTAVVLGKLSAAFRLSVSSLLALAEGEAPVPDGTAGVRRSGDATEWRDPDTGYRRRQITGPRFPAETAEIRLPAGAAVSYPAASFAFARQVVWVLDGRLTFHEGPPSTTSAPATPWNSASPHPAPSPTRATPSAGTSSSAPRPSGRERPGPPPVRHPAARGHRGDGDRRQLRPPALPHRRGRRPRPVPRHDGAGPDGHSRRLHGGVRAAAAAHRPGRPAPAGRRPAVRPGRGARAGRRRTERAGTADRLSARRRDGRGRGAGRCHRGRYAAPGRRGRAMATVATGLSAGILLGRWAGGSLADLLGWRRMLLVFAGLALLGALATSRLLPRERPRPGEGYPAALAAMAPCCSGTARCAAPWPWAACGTSPSTSSGWPSP